MNSRTKFERSAALWFFVCGLGLVGCSANPELQSSTTVVGQEIRTVLDNYVAAVNNLDLELAESIYSKSGSISFINPRGHQRGWVDIRDGFFRKGMGSFATRELKLKDVEVRVLTNESAWADFYWDFDAVFQDGQPIQTSGRETQIFLKEEDGWKIVHVHYSGPATQREREGF